ncbi:MAG: geranylgeranyl reductase family protein [Promethearchaeota archaeon]
MRDVIVVGGGPAGSMAGYFLARAGLSCLLLDKASFPRDKPCGGALTPRLFEKYPFLTPFRELVSHRGFIHGAGPGETISNEKLDEPLGCFCRRRVFDAQLLDLARGAGVEVREGARVVDIQQRDGGAPGVRVRCSNGEAHEARFAVGADGVNSRVRKASGLRGFSRGEDLAVVYVREVEVGEDVVLECCTADYVSHMHFLFGDTTGYGWVFPKRAHLNVGFGAMAGEVDPVQARRVFDSYASHCKERGLIPDIPLGRPCPWFIPMRGPLPEFSKGRVLLAGDAAGFVHPMTGEGILYAIWSGEIAANTIASSLRGGPDYVSLDEVAEVYQRRCMAEFGRELLQVAKLRRFAGSKIGLVFRVARRDPKLIDLLDQMMTGRAPLREVKWKMIWRLLRGVLSGKARKGKKSHVVEK